MQESSNDIYISKTLSWLLRHGAIEEKLNIDAEGYINIEDILNHKRLKEKCNVKDILRIVEQNNKKRFSVRTLQNNILQIRAVQGHSINVCSVLFII